ncbi:MAG: serine/threonine-protein kinase [Planctomycetota bacterium]
MAQGGDLTGKTIGKCRILGRLGHGRTSNIYRAFYEPLGKEVAVKVLKKTAKATPELRQKFLNEAKALGQLDHPNIVKVFDVVEEGPFLFIIMELLKGDDLFQILEEDGHIEADEAVGIVGRVAKALAEAHRQGIVHRDVKPANIMLVGPRGDVKLLDFGLATAGVTAGQAGTPHYMSPEQIQGKTVTEKSDVYSLGATFFHMLTGRPPYPAKTAKVIKEKHLEGNLPTPSRAGKAVGVPKAVDPVVKKMMAPVAGYRANARDLAGLLGSLNLAAGGRRKKKHAIRAASRRGANVPLIAGISIAAVIMIAVVAFFFLSGGNDEPPPMVDNGDKPKVDTTQTPTIRNRADEARAREVKAQRMFAAAQSFERQSYGKDQEVFERYKKVWDEYGETASGQKARTAMKAAEERMNREKVEAEKRAAAEKLKKALPAFEKDLAALRKEYDFPGMADRILQFLTDHDLTPKEEMKWIVLVRRLEYADKFITDLAKAITENSRKHKVTLYKEDGPKDAKIQSADGESVIILEGTLEVKKPWSYFKPGELVRMFGRQVGLRGSMPNYLVANFQYAMGNDAEGEGSLFEAKAQQIGTEIDELEKKLHAKPRGSLKRETPFGDDPTKSRGK